MFRYKSFNGHVAYEHGGTGIGAINENLVDSVTGICISLLTNQDSADNDMLLEGVIRALHKVTLAPPTGIAFVIRAAQLEMYPNPACGQLHVRCSEDLLNAEYSVIDVSGRIVFSGVIRAKELTIPVNNLANGNYNLTIAIGNNYPVVVAFSVLH
jgi:hypothetical protein